MNAAVKALRGLDGVYGGVFIIDEVNGYAEIAGDHNVKEFLFEVSSHVIKRWKEMSDNKKMEEKKPEGAKWFLPFLPVGGIDKMTLVSITLYWSPVMRTVCADRGRNLGYGNKR